MSTVRTKKAGRKSILNDPIEFDKEVCDALKEFAEKADRIAHLLEDKTDKKNTYYRSIANVARITATEYEENKDE